jgi:hypothetical protein
MNSKDISSTPNTIQNYDNYLKDYVNTSGFSWNSTCLDVAFKNLGNKFSDYVNKVGDFNTVTATNPIYTPPRSYQEKNYSGPCPEGWTINPIWGNYSSCTNQSYTGPCNAGQSIQTPIAASCPAKNVGNPTSYQNSYNYWSWNWVWGRRYGSYSTPNNNSYTGWYGPTDASQGDFANTNIGSQPPGAGSYCTAGWSAGNSQGGSQADCTSSGGTWVNYYNDPTWGSHGYTCYKPTQYNWTTKPPSYFWGYTPENKRNWENQCQAYWPMQTINIPGKWTCTYGTSILNDIAAGNLFQIRTSEPINSPSDAARIVLKNSINTNQMSNNYFFMVNNNIYITSPTSNIGIITSKGQYQPNCTQQNNQKGTLYYISEAFFDLVKKCATVNNAINQTNNNRDVLQASIDNSIKENFTTAEILQNQDEIIRNLANNYNKKAELYNYQIDVIGNNEKLVNTQNTKLNKQFDEMTAIQEQIALKSRVIELNDDLVKKQLRNKKFLIGFFVLLPFLGIPLLLMIIGAFSPIMGISLAGLLILGYVIYVLVISNSSEIKKFGRENKQIMSKYENAISNYWNKEKELLSKSLSNFVYGKCEDGSQQQEEEEESSGSGGRNIAYPKGDYIMKSNGPFYYYDGSAPPQQIYPGAIGSINFNIEGNNYKFPKEISEKFNEIKNPITQFFFQTWSIILTQNGISFDDPRFSQDLDVIDFTDTDQTPMPFWDNIKLPIVTNIEQQFNYLFQSYNKEKKTLSKTASVLLVDLWNFVFGDKIPGDVYETWVKKLADVVKQSNPNIEQFYQDYLQSIMSLPKFKDKYGTINKFVELKMIDFIKTFNQDIHVSTPFAKKMVA